MIDSIATSAFAGSAFSIAALVFAVLGALLVAAAIVALFRLRLPGFILRSLAGSLLLSLGALSGAVALGMQGYRALTREDVAARLSVRPTAPQRFEATFRLPDGNEFRFPIAGDEVYVDARILKWKPLANVLGLHTAYELDRVAGRYRDIEQERNAPRTVYLLFTSQRAVDLFALRQRYAFLAPLLDAEYGSASFVAVTQPAELEVRVSTTGLLIREAAPPRENTDAAKPKGGDPK